ncbi:MAG: glycosyltransferase family 4 protein [Akkermansiaceae bacterium]|nr:glycosyltransferase family 4 protein [Akkermansiaceae bacterium]
MDILFASPDSHRNTDGPRVWTRRLALALAERGKKVGVAVIRRTARAGYLEEQLEGSPVTVFSRDSGSHSENARWIESLVRENRPAVLVAQHHFPALTACYRLRSFPVETVMVMHSDDTLYWRLSDFYLKPGQECPKHLVCVSRYLFDRQTAARVNDDAYEIHQVPYGVEVPPELPAREPNPLRLLYVGRMTQRQKRIRDVVRAFCAACEAVPGTTATLVGAGREEAEVRELAETLPGGSALRFTGLLTAEETREEFGKHDAIVLLSDYEGLPISLMEAMAWGLVPVVTKMTSGIPELVQDGETGLVVDNRGEAFTAAVRALSSDHGLRTRLSEAAARKIREGYGLDQAVGFWEGLIHSARTETGREEVAEIRETGFPRGLWRQPWGDASVAPWYQKPIASLLDALWAFWIRIPVERRVRIKRLFGRRDPEIHAPASP